MVKQILYIALIVFVWSCKKSNERKCYKSYGEDSVKEIALDSVYEFKLYKNLTYHVYQDTQRVIKIYGGKNVIDFVEVNYSAADYQLSVHNKNSCNFIRDFDKKIIVEIHYPFFEKIYSETNDSLIFMDTIFANKLYIEQAQGGGGVRLNVITNDIVLIASGGVGTYKLGGQSNYADLRVQIGGFGDAFAFKANNIQIFQNSTADIKVNLENAATNVVIRGTGNVIYKGNPTPLNLDKTGDGNLIQE